MAGAVTARALVQGRAATVAGELRGIQAVVGLPGRGHAGVAGAVLGPLLGAQDDQLRAETRLAAARGAAMALLWLVVAGTVGVVAVVAGQALLAGTLDGPYAALVALVPVALADPWVGAAEIAGSRVRSRAAAARIETFLAQEPAVTGDGLGDELGAVPPCSPFLELRNVTARWEMPGPVDAPDLGPLDLRVAPGDRLQLTGPNGVGKSTALAVLARHLDPATGSYALAALGRPGDRLGPPRLRPAESVSGISREVRRLDLEQTRALLAVVDDEPHAFAGSVRANLLLARPDATDDDLLEALEAVDLAGWFCALPAGLDTPLTGLSGGERARLSLARALVSRRPVVLLDEPAAHLDDATAERALGGALGRLDPTASVVLVSHGPAWPVAARWRLVPMDSPGAAPGETSRHAPLVPIG